MTPLGAQAILIGKKFIGVTEHPPGSNRGPEVDMFIRVGSQGRLNPANGSYPWCACFVSYCVLEAIKTVGAPQMFIPSAGALALLQLNYRLRIPDPEPGCVGVIDHGGGKGHAFFITDVKKPTLDTLEGNSDRAGSRTGGSVVELNRPIIKLAGWFRIQ